MPLTLAAEPFQPSGSMAGEGVRKLLGTPSVSRLRVMIREAGQNSWDARSADEGVSLQVHLRTLTRAQGDMLRDEVFASLPDSAGSADLLRQALSVEAPVLLEVADFGTRGLAGPTRADIALAEGEPSNFVNFVRNVGVGMDRPQNGGTYGYGKTSFYRASAASTVLIDSLAQTPGGVERRFIACHLGDEFNHASRRFTGRHWWGAPTTDPTLVEPLTGAAAEAMAEALGLPARNDTQTGTTIAVLAPAMDDAQAALGEILEALVWYFWPKMIADPGAPAPMGFTVRHDGAPVPLPRPESVPPLDLFIRAWREVKDAGPGSESVWCGRPRKHLGRLAIERGFRSDRRALAPDSVIPHTSSHIALMRPAEWVVKYLEGPRLPQGAHEWGGVFICDSDPVVERAFAHSEPPAHDDWMPESMEKGNAQTFVRVGLKRIAEAASAFVYPRVQGGVGPADQPSLARAAAALGALVPRSHPLPAGRASGVIRGQRRRWSVQPPRFLRIEDAGEAVDALFQVAASNGSDQPLRISAAAGIVIDDEISEATVLPDGREVIVVGWETSTGEPVAAATDATLGPRESLDALVRVRIPGLAAVGLRLSAQD